MKFKYLFIIPLIILGSCSDILDLEPEDFLSPSNFYEDEDDAMSALTGVYDILGHDDLFASGLFYEMTLGTDLAVVNRSYYTTGMLVYNYGTGASVVAGSWAALYDGVNRANSFIENLPNVPDLDEDVEERMMAEARFLRGFYHFILTTNWGDVPIKLSTTTSVNEVNIAKSPQSEVYDQIIEDMEFAESRLPAASDIVQNGRICKGAAQGILARVCLYMAGEPLMDTEKYADALVWAQAVVDSKEHTLNAEYSQVFINHSSDLYDIKESMFEVEFYGNRTTEGYNETSRLGCINGIKSTNYDIGYSYALINTTAKFYELYDANDIRRDWNIAPFYYNEDGSKTYDSDTDLDRYPGKWRRENELVLPKNKNYTPTNFPVLRYSDVLLMLAEAENEVNGPTDKAYDAINAVRTRANAESLNSGLSKDEFKSILIDERARELAFEGLRKYDLIRWGIFISTMKASAADITARGGYYSYTAYAGNNVAERHKLHPIPANELALNNLMTQNEGW